VSRHGLRRLSIADVDDSFLDRALRENETLFIEWKQTVPPDGLGPTVASFANTLGGWFILGVEDETGEPKGWSAPGRDNIQDWVRNRLANEVDPAPPFVAREVEYQGQTLGLIRVFESTDTPHIVTDTGALYVRTEGGKQHVKDHRTLLALAERGQRAVDAANRRLDDPQALPFAEDHLGMRFPRTMFADTDKGWWTIIVRATPLTLLPAFAERAHSKTFVDGLIERTEALWPDRETVHAAKLSTPHQFGCVVTREMKSNELRSGNWCRVAVVVDAGGIVGIHVRDPLDPDDAGGWSVATPGLATARLEPLLGFVAECLVDLDAIGRCRADVHIRGLNDHQVSAEAGRGQFKNDGGQHFSGELVVPAEADDLAELAADWRRQLERNAGIASWH
jgi:hypothetical protein